MNGINIGTGTGGVGSLNLIIQAIANFDQQAAQMYDATLWNPNTPANIQTLNLTSGANTISASNCPSIAQAGGVILIPPPSNAVTITLKGSSGDTGVPLSTNAPTVWTFATVPPTSFVLTTGSTIAGFRLLWF